jgi:hypothetical protein
MYNSEIQQNNVELLPDIHLGTTQQKRATANTSRQNAASIIEVVVYR